MFGFHAARDHCVDHFCSRVSVSGTASVVAYLADLDFDGSAIWYFISTASTSITWMTPEAAARCSISYPQYSITGQVEQH
jgi:hypothetical protein